MRAGYASVDITPTKPGITLSGFAARCNRPSEGTDDPLTLHALVLEEQGETVLTLVYDLVGIGPELLEKIHKRLDAIPHFGVGREYRILCATHTHSGPAAAMLIGCGIPDPEYWDFLAEATAHAACEALESLRPARLRYAVVPLAGHHYNRRQVLEDGRVTLARNPGMRVKKSGPTWDQMMFVRLEDPQGEAIAGVVHWATHACTVGGNKVSADFPGELCRRLGDRFGMPFLYLQGACGNLNPPYQKMIREEMLDNVDRLMRDIPDIPWQDLPTSEPFGLSAAALRLAYDPIPSAQELRETNIAMCKIAETGSGPAEAITTLADILNTEPGHAPDPVMMRYIAGALAEWSILQLEKKNTSGAAGCDLSLKVLRLGPLVFCFVAAEVFVETALALKEAFPDRIVNIVGYASPMVGYLPTDEAIEDGGYEAEYAYRFYGHPAPWAKGSEGTVVHELKGLILQRHSMLGSLEPVKETRKPGEE